MVHHEARRAPVGPKMNMTVDSPALDIPSYNACAVDEEKAPPATLVEQNNISRPENDPLPIPPRGDDLFLIPAACVQALNHQSQKLHEAQKEAKKRATYHCWQGAQDVCF